jgi:lipopolysaccharide export LptBFGC system permease protein LptF
MFGMKTLRIYIARSFFTTFLVTVAVLTFIISIGGLFKITDLLAKGIAAGPILRVFLSGLPDGMVYAIPVGTLTAALLVFGRLSGDNEVTAMRACGISISRVASWLFPFALAAVLVCLYVNSELVPFQHYVRWKATSELRADAALSILEIGRTVELGEDLRVFVGGIRPDGTLEQIRIFDQRDAGRMREIKADLGQLADDSESGAVVLSLEKVTIDPFQFDSPGAAYSERWQVSLAQGARQVYVQRDKHRTFHDLYVMARALELEVDNLREADWLRMRARQILHTAHMEAEGFRLRAWTLREQAKDAVEQMQESASAIRAQDTSGELLRRAAQLEQEVLQEAARLDQEALAREQGVTPMARLLQRHARDLERSSGESEARLLARVMDMRVVLNQRILLSLTPILFLYFGIPMGIRPHRKETSVGIAASLFFMFAFYIVLSLIGEFKGHPHLRPDLLVWIPGVMVLLADIVLLRRLR